MRWSTLWEGWLRKALRSSETRDAVEDQSEKAPRVLAVCLPGPEAVHPPGGGAERGYHVSETTLQKALKAAVRAARIDQPGRGRARRQRCRQRSRLDMRGPGRAAK